MKTQDRIKRVTHWHADITQMQETLDRINSAIGLAPEGDLEHACSCMMSALTLTTAELIQDQSEWLEWYWLENGMGKKGLKAGRDGEERPIRGLDDLVCLLGLNMRSNNHGT